MNNILIKNALIVTMDNEMAIKYNTNILIENGIIKYIGKNAINNVEKIIDAKNCIVLPGLCNMHTHIGMTLLRGYAEDINLNDWLQNKIWPIEKCFTKNTVKVSSLLSCLEMIKSGTTSFCDMYYHVDKIAEATSLSGLRGCLSYGMIDNGDSNKGKNELEVSKNLIKKWNNKDNNRIKIMLGPHSPYTCSLNFLEKVKDLSIKENVKIHIHVLETENELNESKKKYGLCPINYLDKINFWDSNVLAAHCVWLSKNDINILSEKNVTVVHNPISNMKLGSGIAPIVEMNKKRVNVTLGTDGCASNNNLNLFEEMKITPLIQKGISLNASLLKAYDILKMATSNSSSIIGEKIGMIKVGYKADIIIIDTKKIHLSPYANNLDPYSLIIYSATGSDVRDSIIDGKLIMENKVLLNIDEEKIIDNANKELEIILNKINT